jgi:hypothetical protein
MAQNEIFQGKMDPEIAALLGVGVQQEEQPHDDVPDYASLFSGGESEEPQSENDEPDLTSGGFPEITKNLEEVPHNVFDDPNYFKTVLTAEGDIAQRLHGILQKFLNTKDLKDKSVFRQQLIPASWDFISSVGRKAAGKLVDPKKFFLRYGLLHPTFLNNEDRTFFSRIVVENTLNQPVYYMDEWLKAVGTGVIRNSSTDEVRVAKSGQSIKLQQLLEKAKGKQDGAKVLLKAKDQERLALEKSLIERVGQIADHYAVEGLPDINSCYTDIQKRIFVDVQELLKSLVKADREQEVLIRDYYQAEGEVQTLGNKIEEDGGVAEVDIKAVDTELDTIRQMAKMTIGRQGNHFPILTSEYFHCLPGDVGSRENVISTLAWIESVDAEAFCRSYKNRLNRIVPYVVIIPSYGDSGMCWEPFDRFNRATSRGRIAVPMYPKNLHIAVLTAVADLRWQVAKEKASYYWMEEGITGNYFQWFQKMKLKGDLKESFIEDYIVWMTKESEGIQKLDKEVRGVFWRHMPFTQPVKDKLKGRSYVYQELYQRDINRSMSDGY